jgi:hypothetical protein
MAIDVLDPPNELLKLPPEGSLKSDETRLESAEDAQRLVTLVLQEDQNRSYQRAVVKGCYDGNAPYNEAKRRRDGLGWSCNLNWLGLEGIIDSARVPYYALFSGVPTYANFKTSYQPENPDNTLWNQRVEHHFTCLLNRWTEFKWHMQASQFEMLFEGWGPLIHEDDSDWRFRAIPARSLLVPQGSPSCLDKRVPFVVVRCGYRIHELYGKIKDEKSARDLGWNIESTQYAIRNATRGNGGSPTWKDQPWEVWQQKFKNKELTTSYTDADVITCAHVFVQEFSGKVSHFIVTEQPMNSEDKSKNGFLFRHPNRFDNYHQAVNVCFQNTGDGTWHSVRGIGLKSFKHEEVRNRLNCRAVDNAFLRSGLILKGLDQKSSDKMQLMVHNAVTYIPPGTDVVDGRANGDIEGVLSVSRYLENQLNNKIGHFSRSPSRDDGRGEQPTATQVEFQAANDSRLSGAQIDNYYNDLDVIYAEVFRRVLISSDPEAKRFREDCEADGVPTAALKNMEYVRANRLSGYGSPQMRKMAMQESMGLVSMMNEEGKNNWLNEAIATVGGADKVTLWNPPMKQPDIDASMATLENGAIVDGVQPLVISGMNNVQHLQIHLDFAEQRLAPVKEAVESGQGDPAQLEEAYNFVSILGDHAQQHMDALESDSSRKQLTKYFEARLKNLAAFHGKLRSAVRTAQAQAQQQAMEQQNANALGIMDQAKYQSAQLDMEIKAQKAKNDMNLKNMKAGNQAKLNNWKAQTDNQRKTAQVAEDIRLERLTTAADISFKSKSLNGKGSKRSKE